MRTFALALLTGLVWGSWLSDSTAWAEEGGNEVGVDIRFVDSATGYSLQPELITAKPHREGEADQQFGRACTGADGRATIRLGKYRYTISASLATHHPVGGEVNLRDNFPYRLRFLLDPIEKPEELQPANIAARQRDDATLFQGFIVSEESGRPLAGVHVRSTPSGVQTTTDIRGYYQLYIPLQSPANLIIEKPGYRSEQRDYLELSPRGDWTYNFRLEHGSGAQTLDERSPLRRAIEQDPDEEITPVSKTMTRDTLITPKATLPSNATIRVPRNIRVQDDTNIYYVSMDFYEKHTLPHEWIASWNSNSLNAGSVPVRCYAIARINGRGPDTDFDICGDSNCQNFKATVSASSTDKAVDYTAGYVVVNASGNIPSTEYSAENNSLGLACGDGFTAPTGGCLYDPICAGHDRSGHGRGMCQRGTHRWGGVDNGYPTRDWIWMINHYYPTYKLVKGAVLVIGDDVKSTSSDCSVRACAGGGIDSGVLCPLITNKASGQTGVIIGGPLVVTNDNKGFTWYQVRWNDTNSTTGWSCENYLERVVSAPTVPSGLTAIASSSTQINLSWTDSSNIEAGFYVERAPGTSGPWLQVGAVTANITSYSDRNLYPGSTWYYRVRSYNSAGNSSYTTTAGATTPNTIAPTLAAIPNRVVAPGTLITFTNAATAPENVKLITDFDAFQSETGNGAVLFRTPNNSSTTTNFLNGAPEFDISAVTDTYPSGGQSAGNVLMTTCQFTNVNNAWLRLTTAGATYFPDPVIDITRKLRFDIYASETVQVAVGCRETTTAIGTAIGTDGGTSGAIEWAGVTNVSGTAPMPSRALVSNTWTTLTFNFPNETIRSFSSGNGVLSTSSGLGVLEHLAIVPGNGTNVYTLYLDNFSVLYPRTFTYSLGSGAPTGATIDANTGVFSWTPSQSQSPSTNTISVIVTDDSSPPLRATNSFTVTVSQSTPTLIVTQPQSTTANVGADAVFGVEASGTLLRYQWLFNGNVLPASTNTTLTISNCQLTNAGSYSVIVSNATDTLTSSDAALVVFAPITVSAAPSNRTNNIGDNAQFSVSAVGTNLTYQWQCKGVDIANATNSTLNIPVNDATNEGLYTVVISSPVATNVTASATLSLPYVELTKIAQWNFNSNPADDNLATGQLTPSLGIGSVATFGGATGLFGDSVTSDPASLGLDNTSWLITNYPPSSAGNKIRGIQVNASTLGYDRIVVTWEQRNNARSSKYARFQYTTNGADWVDGDVINHTSYANFQFKSTDLSDVPGVGNNPNFAFRIVAEWESTATGSGSAAYVPSNPSSTYNTDAVIRFDMVTVLGSITEPTIVSQPQSVTRQAGQSAVFNVGATGVNLSYRWQRNGVDLQNGGNIFGADTATLTIDNLSANDAGSFVVVVNAGGGLFSVESDPAVLFFFAPVSITQQPQGRGVNAGTSVTLSAQADGTTPISYQWKKNGSAITGAVQPTLTITNFQSANAGTYTLVVNNGTTVESAPAVLFLNVAPVVTSQPLSITAVADTAAVFTVGVSGAGPFAYQWRKNGIAISGAAQSSFTVASAKQTDAGSYSVLITNAAGTVTSSNAVLKVSIVKPVIVSQPASRTDNQGASATFHVAATGGYLTYQWKRGTNLIDNANVSGTQTDTLTISNVTSKDAGLNYSVIVKNVAGSATSTLAALTVTVPATITSGPTNQLVLYNSTAIFRVTAAGTAPLVYQWYKNGTNKLANFTGHTSGGTTSALTISSCVETDVGSYAIVVSNQLGAATSSNAVLRIVPRVVITSPAANAAFTTPSIVVNGTASDASGKAITQVKCQLNGGPIFAASGTTTWSAAVSLRAGTNIFSVTSVNAAGIESLAVTRVFFFNVTSPLTLSTTGIGTVSGATSGQLLLVGRSYKLTATPGAGQIFSNWTGTVTANTNRLTFVMQSNMHVIANFVPNPFPAFAGIYNGLFFETNALNHNSSGFFAFTLASTGAYSGRYYLGGRSYSMSGRFAGDGSSHLVHADVPTVVFDFQLDLTTSGTETIAGTVTGGTWSAPLFGGRAKYLYSPPAPQSGAYTVALTGSSDGIDSPGGDGFGTVMVSTAGQVTFSGRVSDDTTVVPPVTYLTKAGDWPFYAPLYGGKGSVMGWLTNVTAQPKTYQGAVVWIKTGTYGSNYYAGFTNALGAVSSTLPSLTSTPAFNSPNAKIVLSGGPLVRSVTNYFWLNNNTVTIFAGQTNGLTLTLSKSNGQWTGSFKDPTTATKMAIRGILLNQQNEARGYFVGPQTGAMSIEPY